ADRCAHTHTRRERRSMAADLPAAAAPPASGRVFPGAAVQVREARRFLAGVLDGCPAGDDALLCASELATNAVLYSRSGRPGRRLAVRAAVRPGRGRVEVEADGGRGRAGGENQGEGGQTGRTGREGRGGGGLVFAGQVGSGGGRDDHRDRRTVWFEIDC